MKEFDGYFDFIFNNNHSTLTRIEWNKMNAVHCCNNNKKNCNCWKRLSRAVVKFVTLFKVIMEMPKWCYEIILVWVMLALQGSILESKGMHVIFQKKGKKMSKKGKIFKNLGKNIQNLTMFWKRAGDCVRLLHALNC